MKYSVIVKWHEFHELLTEVKSDGVVTCASLGLSEVFINLCGNFKTAVCSVVILILRF